MGEWVIGRQVSGWLEASGAVTSGVECLEMVLPAIDGACRDKVWCGGQMEATHVAV